MCPFRPESASLALHTLKAWLVSDAYPVWAVDGFDEIDGGFHERLAAGGPVPGEPRRARVQLRQIYCFARAAEFGWQGDAQRLVTAGLRYFFAHYRRPDGFFRTLVAPDGAVVDDRAILYDQAFALLAFAQAHEFLGPNLGLLAEAEALLGRLYERLGRSNGGFRSEVRGVQPLSSNPHMHLLEAALAWVAASGELRWRHLASELSALALDRMIDARAGVLREYFDECWAPFPGLTGRLIEPGHQFEWAWLLLRGVSDTGDRAFRAAARLIDISETHGIHRGAAVNALLDDLTFHDAEARLWPQTERLKAHTLMALLTREPGHWLLAARAVESLTGYLDTGSRGLWHDRRKADGSFIAEPSPASTFYHLVCAIGALAAALDGAA